MNKLKTLFLASMLALSAVACSSSNEESTGTGTQPQSSPPSETGTQSDSVTTQEVVMVDTVMGEKEQVVNPERVTILGSSYTEHILALGILPAATVEATYDDSVLAMLEGTEFIGNQAEPSMETILATYPDVIIGSQDMAEQYDVLDKIAPTFLFESSWHDAEPRDFRENFKQIAMAVGMEEKAEEVIAEYEKKAAAAKIEIEELIGDKNAMILRVTTKDLRYYSPKLMGTLYTDLGVSTPPMIPDNTSTYESMVSQYLLDVNPDYIFVLVSDTQAYDELKETVIWKELDAVKNNNVQDVLMSVWMTGDGPISSGIVIDNALELFRG